MQRSLATAFRASMAAADDNKFLAHANPAMIKTWKSYSYTRNQRIQQLSPFEIDVLGPLFRNIGDKIKHKFEDNFWDAGPPLLFFAGLVVGVKALRKDMLYHHRD